MPRKGENIYKRKDGRWEGRYVKGRNGKKAIYGYVYSKSYSENIVTLVYIINQKVDAFNVRYSKFTVPHRNKKTTEH